MSPVKINLFLFSGFVGRRVNHSPYFNVPSVGQEVRLASCRKGQGWFIGVFDAMLRKPVGHFAFIARAHLLAILCLVALAVKSIRSDRNAVVSKKLSHRGSISSIRFGNIIQCCTGFIHDDEFTQVNRIAVNIKPGFSARYFELFAPVINSRLIDVVDLSYLRIGHSFNMQHVFEFFLCWYRYATTMLIVSSLGNTLAGTVKVLCFALVILPQLTLKLLAAPRISAHNVNHRSHKKSLLLGFDRLFAENMRTPTEGKVNDTMRLSAYQKTHVLSTCKYSTEVPLCALQSFKKGRHLLLSLGGGS